MFSRLPYAFPIIFSFSGKEATTGPSLFCFDFVRLLWGSFPCFDAFEFIYVFASDESFPTCAYFLFIGHITYEIDRLIDRLIVFYSILYFYRIFVYGVGGRGKIWAKCSHGLGDSLKDEKKLVQGREGVENRLIVLQRYLPSALSL